MFASIMCVLIIIIIIISISIIAGLLLPRVPELEHRLRPLRHDDLI